MAELHPQSALDQARKMIAYCHSFNGQKWSPALDSVDRQNLATALDNLEETASMLLNVAERCATQPKAEPTVRTDPTQPWTVEHLKNYPTEAVRVLNERLADERGSAEPCPTCGAPCKTEVLMRGGDHGWGTTDKERTVYRYAARAGSEPGLREVLRSLSHDLDDAAQHITERQVYDFATQIRVLIGLDGSEAASAAIAERRAEPQGQPAQAQPAVEGLTDADNLRRKLAALPWREIEAAPGVYTRYVHQGAMLTAVDDFRAALAAAPKAEPAVEGLTEKQIIECCIKADAAVLANGPEAWEVYFAKAMSAALSAGGRGGKE